MIKTSRILLALGVFLACLQDVASPANALAGLGYGGGNSGSRGSVGGSAHGGGTGGNGASVGGASAGSGGQGGSTGGTSTSASGSYNGSRANYGLGAGANYGLVPARGNVSDVGAGYGPGLANAADGQGVVGTSARSQPQMGGRQAGTPSQLGPSAMGMGAFAGAQVKGGFYTGPVAPSNHGLGAGTNYGQPSPFRGGLLSAITD